MHMAQVTNSQPSTVPQTGADDICRRKACFTILLDGMHEHYLVDMRTEVTIFDTLRNIIKTTWKKQQSDSQEVGRNADSNAEAS
jgi:hypothetical protein